MKEEAVNSYKPIFQLADSFVFGVRNLLIVARTEEDLRICFEKFLEPVKSELNLDFICRYERSIYNGRPDAVHGQLIIEYKPLGASCFINSGRPEIRIIGFSVYLKNIITTVIANLRRKPEES